MIEFAQRNFVFFKSKELKEQSQYALEVYSNNYMKNCFQVMLFHRELLLQFESYRKEFAKHFLKVLTNPRLCRMKRLAIGMLPINKKASYKLCKKYFPECILEMGS